MRSLSVAAVLLLTLSACAPTAPVPSPAGNGAPASSPPAEMGPVRFVLVSNGSEARYVAKETLAGFPLPSDAAGRTRAVSGTIAFDRTGAVDPAQSKITVDAASFKSEQAQPVNNRPPDEIARLRDNFVKDRMLQAAEFPTIDFVPTKVTGLPVPLPASGKADFQITGDLTAHGVKKAVTWDVSATFTGSEVSGTAKTKALLSDFNITRPTLTLVLSIEDELRMEIDFKAAKQ